MTPSRTQQARLLVARAQALLAAGLPAQAREAVRQALSLDPENAVARLVEARAHLQEHRPAEAIRSLNAHPAIANPAVDAVDPSASLNLDAAFLRLRSLIAAGEWDVADELGQRLARELPDDVRPHRFLAGLAMARQRPEQAIAPLRQVVRLEPSDRGSRRLLVSLLAESDPSAAMDVLLAQGQDLDSADLLQRARLWRRLDRHAEAAEDYRSLLRDEPADATIWLEAGQVSDVLGDSVTAVGRIAQAVSLDPRRMEAWEAWGRALLHAGRVPAAGRVWWGMARRWPSSGAAWAGLLVAALATDRPSLAAKARQRLTRTASPAEQATLLAEAWVHTAGATALQCARAGLPLPAAERPRPLMGLLSRARMILEVEARRHPGRADVQYHLAVCRHAHGGAAEALPPLRQALAINPRYDAARRFLERLEPPVEARAA